MAERDWEAWEDELRHPDGRADNGEPCVVCGSPVPLNAHWKWRDRHACSSRCNTTLRRRLNRRIERGDAPGINVARAAPAVVRPAGPAWFATVPDQPFPYQHAGLSPLLGDAVERHGSVTWFLEPDPPQTAHGRPVLLCWHEQSGSVQVIGVSDAGNQANALLLGVQLPDGSAADTVRPTFTHEGVEYHWFTEVIRAVDGAGDEYTWTATLCSPFPLEDRLWTPEYRERSERLQRITRSTSAHRRRQRIAAGPVDRIDPVEVFEADGWQCRLCNLPIDPDRRHPDPFSASLDHIIPLAAGGTHTRANVQASHLRCNVRKGAQVHTRHGP